MQIGKKQKEVKEQSQVKKKEDRTKNKNQ